MSSDTIDGDSFGLVGHTLDKRYRVDRVVGQGGFGVVYAGYHLAFDHAVAIKCLKVPSHFGADARRVFFERFRSEGRLLSKLSQHAGIVRVYDFGDSDATGSSVPYLVLEWLEGDTLEDVLRKRAARNQGPFTPAEAVRLLMPAIEAVAFAHSTKVAHRDIKPANLFLTQGPKGPTLKVLDFGIAKAMQDGDVASIHTQGTSSGFHAFSPPYGAPEQFFAKRYGETGPWTDVHALALLLVEMMTLHKPYPGEEYGELLEAATREVRPTPRAIGFHVHESVEAICVRALARTPKERYQNAQQFYDALASIQGLLSQHGNQQATLLDPLTVDSRTSAPNVETSAFLELSARSPSYPDGTPIGSPRGATPYGSTPHGSTPAGSTPHGTMESKVSSSGTQIMGVAAAQTALGPPPTTVSGVRADDRTASGFGASVATHGEPPARKQGGGGKVVWSLVGIAGLVGAGVGGFFLYKKFVGTEPVPGGATSSATGSGSGEVVASASAPKPPGKTGVETYRNVNVFGREVEGIDPISSAAASKEWHYRVRLRDGRVTNIEKVNPAGRITAWIGVDRPESGGYTLRYKDAMEVATDVDEVTTDGIVVRTLRSGVKEFEGCFKKRLEWDDKGRVAATYCLDQNGDAVVDVDGCQVKKFAWDTGGHITSQKCLYTDGSPANEKMGIHEQRYDIDKLGFTVGARWFGPDEKPATDVQGCNGTRWDRDAGGNVTAYYCLDADGKPKNYGDNLSGEILDYDANGCIVKRRSVDAAGQQSSNLGVAQWIIRVDNVCHELHKESVGVDGKLVAPNMEAAVTDWVFNGEGLIIEQRCFGADQKPIQCAFADPQPEGSVARYEYDSHGREIWRKTFDQTGKATKDGRTYPHEQRQEYGKDGRLAARSFFDENGNPATALEKLHKSAFTYDALGETTSMRSFGTDGQPIADSTGCHEQRFAYDAMHRMSGIECRGTSGELAVAAMCKAGVCWPANAVRVAIERSNQKVTNVYYDLTGNVVKVVDCLKDPCYQ